MQNITETGDVVEREAARGLLARLYSWKVYLNAASLVADRCIRAGSNVVVVLLVARAMSVADYALYALSITLFVTFSGVQSLCADAVVIRRLVNLRPHDSEPGILTAAISLKATGAIIAAIAAAVYVAADSTLYDPGILWLLVGTIAVRALSASFEVYEYVLQSRSKLYVSAASRIAPSVLFLAAKVGLFYFRKLDIVALLILDALESAAIAWCYRRNALALLRAGRVAGWLSECVSLAQPSVWIVIQTSLALLVARMDQLYIPKIMGMEDLGIYNAAVRLVEFNIIVSTAICAAYFPQLARSVGGAQFGNCLRTLFISITISSGLLILGSFLFRELIVSTVFGPKFVGTVELLNVYIWMILPLSLNNLFCYAANASAGNRSVVLSYGLAALFSASVLLARGAQLDLKQVAIVQLVSQCIVGVLVLCFNATIRQALFGTRLHSSK